MIDIVTLGIWDDNFPHPTDEAAALQLYLNQRSIRPQKQAYGKQGITFYPKPLTVRAAVRGTDSFGHPTVYLIVEVPEPSDKSLAS